MSNPPDLLLITWNRRAYVEKTLATLLTDPGDFRLYCWDNASTDGTADIISSVQDSRIVRKHFNKENANQRQPCLWFFEEATSDVIGKVDDDVLLPAGWTERLARIVRSDERFGMLGCWIFMPEDWDEHRAQKNIIEIGDTRVFRAVSIAGHSFLARRDVLRRYIQPPGPHGLPVDRLRMSVDGLISGYPLPLVFAHNMDDPRSPHNQFTRLATGLQAQSALTARKLGFESSEKYAAWIANDAKRQQEIPFATQLREHTTAYDQSIVGRVRRKLTSLAKIRRHP